MRRRSGSEAQRSGVLNPHKTRINPEHAMKKARRKARFSNGAELPDQLLTAGARVTRTLLPVVTRITASPTFSVSPALA